MKKFSKIFFYLTAVVFAEDLLMQDTVKILTDSGTIISSKLY